MRRARNTIQVFSMATGLTDPQRSVLRFLEERNANGEAPPTYREICEHFGYKSTRAASDHVDALEKKGFVTRDKKCARGLRLIRENGGIPLLGRIIAGIPEEATSTIERRLLFDSRAYGIDDPRDAFALTVRGDSMIGRRIFDGDIVLLQKSTRAKHGDIVAALIDNECTLKTLVHRNGKTWLRAENPHYPALFATLDLQIQGVARAVIRMLTR